MFHNLADIASLRSPYVDSTQAFTSAGFVPVLRRMYLNDYNEAVEFYNSGLEPEDFEMLDKHRIEYDPESCPDYSVLIGNYFPAEMRSPFARPAGALAGKPVRS